jgi:hypothetical protein
VGTAAVVTMSALLALASPTQEFERGRIAFGRGEYLRAMELLRPLLYPELRLETEGEVVQAHRMLGVANLFEGRPAEAKVEFRKLLELRPDYRFDPLLDPPRVVDFFNSVLKEEEDEIAALEAKRKKQEAERAAQRREEAERLRVATAKVILYERHSYVLNFVPFGAGQFQNGQRRKGLAFAGAEVGLAVISVGTFVTNFWLFGLQPHRRCLQAQPVDASGVNGKCPDDQVDHSDEDLSRNLLRVQVVSGGLFFAVAIWGAIDAIRHFQERERIELETTPAPNGAAGPSKPQAGWLKIQPGIPAAPLGLGLSWAF